MSVLARAWGRLFPRRADTSMRAQEGPWLVTKDCSSFGVGAGAFPSSPQPETFEGMVGFNNLCLIARAADNLEATMHELHEAGFQFVLMAKEDQESGSGVVMSQALNELLDALKPYRTARDMHRRP